MRYLTNTKITCALACLLLGGKAFAHDRTSQTFFMPRGMMSDATKELALSNYRLYYNNYADKPYVYPEHKSMFSTQATYFYQSNFDREDLARYFLLGNKTELSVREDGTGDIGSIWLGLAEVATSAGNFNSKFSIRPERQVYGSVTNVHVDFSRWVRGVWFSLLFAPMRAIHDLNFKEFDTNVKGTLTNTSNRTLATIKDALNSDDWYHGRFVTSRMSESGLDDMQFKLGWNALYGHRYHVGIYMNVLVPMGTTPQAKYVFEPVVGTRHWGLGAGLNTDWEFMRFGKNRFNWMVDFKWRYVFSQVERRSFDLKNGQWSRYLVVAKQTNKSQGLDGINFFTRDMSVRPGNMIDAWTALHYRHSDINFEVGYNLWWRASEKVRLLNAWDSSVEDIGIFDVVGSLSGAAVSASAAKINQSDVGTNKAPSDTQFTRITAADLDLNSAAHKSAMSHKIYGAISLNGRFIGQPSMLGIGGGVEFGSHNTALSQWEVWLKTSISV